jgi:predicted dehydrogenase/acetyltransferase-like isoleucine patch superfamily enzyme
MPQAAPALPKIAVLGCGYWGKNIVRNFAELGALAAIADNNPTQAAAIATQHKVPARDWRDILADPTIPAVAIAAPAALHAQLATEALNAGKHVFVEKPLALDVRDAKALCELAASKNRQLMVGHLLQYHPAFLKLQSMVKAGELGRLQYLYSNRLNLGKIRREEDILWSFAPHDISMILALVGSAPDQVTAEGGYYLHNKIADVTTTHLAFPGGERAHIFVSWLHPFKEQKLVVVGDQGMAVFDDGEPWEAKLKLYKHTIDWQNGMPVPHKADGIHVELTVSEPLRDECAHFLHCVATNSTPRTDGREGLRVLEVLAAATAALQQHAGAEIIPLPTAKAAPKTEIAQFPGVTIHPTAFVDAPSTVGAGTKIWHFAHVLARTHIGRDCVLGQNVVAGPDVTIGDRCKIQNNVSLYKGVTLEDGVFCGPSCVFTNVNTPRAEIERKDEFLPTLVKRGATIGANATIVCGNTLGAYCLIAAGAVVTHDVPDFALMAGVPARRIGWVGHNGDKLDDNLICPRTGRRYRETTTDHLVEITAEKGIAHAG